MNILVLDDEREIADLVEVYLKNENYNVFKFYDAKEAINCIESQKLDFAILDVMVKDVDGFKICKRIRDKGLNFPVIMLTAKIEDRDKIEGLTLGADDYITKPFSPSELTARVDAIYRRVCMSFAKPEKNPVIESGPFTLNLKSRTVSKNGKLVELTQVEYQILEYFMSNKNTALDRSSILNHIWGESYFGDDKIVDVNIRRIRMKIEDEPSNPKYIITIWGYGYKWNDKHSS